MNLGIKGQSGTGEIEPSSACYTAFDGERPPGGPRGVGVERVGRTGGRWWIRAGAGTGGEEESGGGLDDLLMSTGTTRGWIGGKSAC